MPKSLLFAVFGLLTLVSGCSSLSANDLVGTYRQNNPWVKNSLTLNSDGTFSQLMTEKSGKKHRGMGQWSFDATDNSFNLSGNYLSYDELGSTGQTRLNSSEHLSSYVEKALPEGKPQIVTGPDEGIAFIKED